MKARLNLLIALIAAIMPWAIKRRLLRLAFGYRLHPSARIGLSLVLSRNLELGEGARIGHMTFIGRIGLVRLDAFSKIGNFNWIAGIGPDSRKHFLDEEGRRSELVIGEHSSITARHFIDCCNAISIGRFTTVAGARSQILTHAIDIRQNRQRSAPVVIGDYCFLGTGCIVLKGAVLPHRSVLAAGSTLSRAQSEEQMIYAGVPAQPVKQLPAESLYFHRTNGFVA